MGLTNWQKIRGKQVPKTEEVAILQWRSRVRCQGRHEGIPIIALGPMLAPKPKDITAGLPVGNEKGVQ